MTNQMKQAVLMDALQHNTKQFHKLSEMSDADFAAEAKFLRAKAAKDNTTSLPIIIDPTFSEFVELLEDYRQRTKSPSTTIKTPSYCPTDYDTEFEEEPLYPIRG